MCAGRGFFFALTNWSGQAKTASEGNHEVFVNESWEKISKSHAIIKLHGFNARTGLKLKFSNFLHFLYSFSTFFLQFPSFGNFKKRPKSVMIFSYFFVFLFI